MAHTINAMSLSGSSGLKTVNGSDQDSASFPNAIVVIDITTITGDSPTATFTVQGKDPISGKYYTIITTAALATAATTVLRIGAGLTASSNLVVSDIFPPYWRVICVQGGTAVTNLTCTVGVQLMDG